MDNYNQGYNPNPNQQYQQYTQPHPQYTQPVQPVYYPPAVDNTSKVMSVGEYIGFFIISAIPILNIIMWIVWLCSSNTNKNKKNLIISYIVLWIIGIVISVIAGVVAAAAGISIAEYM